MAKQNEEKNNFQDAAEDREYDKGKKAGEEAAKENGKAGKGSGRTRGKGKGSTKGSGTNGSGNASDGKDNGEKRSNVSIYTGSSNPIEMHSISDELLNPIGKMVENLRNGYPELFTISTNNTTTGAQKNSIAQIQTSIGGVMQCRFLPTVGVATDALDGLNLGLTETFNYVRSATGGTSYFEAPDLGIYIVAMANCYAYYAEMVKLYGLLKSYSYDNMYIPETVINSMGIDVEDLKRHPEDFRGWINLFGHDIEQLRLPTGFQYVNRMVWMNSNVYLDSPKTNSQMYNFVQTSFYQLQEGITAHTLQYYQKKQISRVNYDLWFLKLIPAPWSYDGVHCNTATQGLATLEDLKSFGAELFRPLNASQDCKYISAAFERAFKDFMQLNPISELYQVKPVYNDQVLSQIENMVTLPATIANYVSTIQENVGINKGYLETVYQFGFTEPSRTYGLDAAGKIANQFAGYNAIPDEFIINKHNEGEITPAEAMEYSRMICGPLSAPLTPPTAGMADSVNMNVDQDPLLQWCELQTIGSNVFLGCDMIAFRYNNQLQPWKGITWTRLTNPVTSIMILYDFSAFFAVAGTAITQENYNMLSNCNTNLRRTMTMLNYLAQWDWHPMVHVYTVTYTTGSGGNNPHVIVNDAGLNLDISTYGIMELKQLTELNNYDMKSQFTCGQIPN